VGPREGRARASSGRCLLFELGRRGTVVPAADAISSNEGHIGPRSSGLVTGGNMKQSEAGRERACAMKKWRGMAAAERGNRRGVEV
jgi:hypothetical protein